MNPVQLRIGDVVEVEGYELIVTGISLNHELDGRVEFVTAAIELRERA